MNDIDLEGPSMGEYEEGRGLADSIPPPRAIEVVTQSYAPPERVETHLSPLDVAPEVFKAGLDRRRQNHKALVEWVRKALVQDVDYGKIHVVKKSECSKGKWCTNMAHFSKDSLFKPGAEKIDAMLGVTPHFPTIKDYEQAAVSGVAVETIILRCELKDSYGNVVAEGVGARSVAKEYGDINKAFKMAEKSGQIDATLRLAGLSEVFTQDVEQMVEDGVFDKAEWQRQDRAKFKGDKGYSQTANYATGGNRDAVLKRDGFACVVCKMTDAEHKATWDRPITVDHISKNRADNSLGNLQTLCLACHGAKDISPELIEPRVPAHKDAIIAMRESGRTYQSIALELGFSIAAIWKWCSRWAEEMSVEAEIIAPGAPQAHPVASSQDSPLFPGSVEGAGSRSPAPARAPVSPETQAHLDEARARREEAASKITSTPEGRQRVRDAGFPCREPDEDKTEKCRQCGGDMGPNATGTVIQCIGGREEWFALQRAGKTAAEASAMTKGHSFRKVKK